MTADSALNCTGDTARVPRDRLFPSSSSVYVKLEGMNPSGSVKDRVALQLIQKAEVDGLPRPKASTLEPSSGNTAIALSMICNIKNYSLTVVIPSDVSEEHRQIIGVFGTQIIGVQPELNDNLSRLRNMGNGYVPELIDFERLDGSGFVRHQDAFEYADELIEKEGLMAGVCSEGFWQNVTSSHNNTRRRTS